MDPHVMNALSELLRVVNDPTTFQKNIEELKANYEAVQKQNETAVKDRAEAAKLLKQAGEAEAASTKRAAEAAEAFAASRKLKDEADLTSSGLDARRAAIETAERDITSARNALAERGRAADERDALIVTKQRQLVEREKELDAKLLKIKQLAA